MTTAVADRTLNALDRCDRCGAQAYVRAVLETSGGELLFCGHHARFTFLEGVPDGVQLFMPERAAHGVGGNHGIGIL
jgi:hypothetical protein